MSDLTEEDVRAVMAKLAASGGKADPAEVAQAVRSLTEEERAELRKRQQSFTSQSTVPGAEPTEPLGPAIMRAAFEAQSPAGTRAVPSQGMNDKALNAGFSTLFQRALDGDEAALFKSPNETWRDSTDRWRRSKS